MPDQQIGPYTIQQLIGGGGMADVYLAWDQANRWPVAVKVLRAAPGKDAKLLRRSEREAALLMKLRHPHIVQVYAAGQAANGRYYIAMEYVAGGDLDDLMRHKPGNKLPVVEAVYLMRRVAGAVAYAHEAGIVHRDLKPGNVLIRADNGEPVVTDLGIAAFAGANPLTGTMESLGTPQYMAPEQISGDRPADGRADVYAIGVMLYELLTGRMPFTGENNWAILLRKQQEAAPPVLTARRDLPPSLAAVIDACLQRDPAARYQTAGALATALDAFLPPDARPPAPVPIRRRGTITPHTPSNPPATPPATGGARSRRRVPLLWAGGAALALVILLALLIPRLNAGRKQVESLVAPIANIQPTEEATNETNGGSSIDPTSTLAPIIDDTSAEESEGELVAAENMTARTRTPTRRPATPARPKATPTRRSTPGTPSARSETAIPAARFTLLEPPIAACPPGAASPQYNGNATITFRWRWADQPAAGNYLEVQAGQPNRLSSLGRLEPSVHRQANGDWAFPLSVSSLYQSGIEGYQWRVVYLAAGGKELAVSATSCFRVSGTTSESPPTNEPTPTARPTVRPTDTPQPTRPPLPTATPQPTAYIPPPPPPTDVPTPYSAPPTSTPNTGYP